MNTWFIFMSQSNSFIYPY
ncbi:hypothetical protein F383_00700 [Gossypium arboreum]|uniref:Uncharacterized protein n=1 Tax=Gossypium arboreum TaxID=29729 RepID=A0A0B0NY47_GOSAR|nr:hypothetical protein F383_00700 [Gossypium arboreum]